MMMITKMVNSSVVKYVFLVWELTQKTDVGRFNQSLDYIASVLPQDLPYHWRTIFVPKIVLYAGVDRVSGFVRIAWVVLFRGEWVILFSGE